MHGTRIAATAAVLAAGLIGALTAPSAAEAKIKLRGSGLEPGFRAKIHDYTVPCTESTRLFVKTTGATKARIGRGRWSTRSRERTVQLREGQAIKVAKKAHGSATTYSIRCLPADFPDYEFTRRQEPRHDFYIMTPDGSAAHYVVVLDSWGVPVWWYRVNPTVAAIDAKVLGKQIVWTSVYGGMFLPNQGTPYEFRRPDGTLVRSLKTVGATTDFHDLQPTRDGNFLLLSYRRRSGVDVSAYKGDAEAAVYDGVVQKLTPDGQLVWEWSTAGHVGLDETGRWWSELEEPYDLVHINAVEPLAGGDILISLRHTDAVYRIDGATGEVEWKLGGTPTENSLIVRNDPYGSNPLAGQHDIRHLGRGVISIYDNGTGLGRAPRAVRYRIKGHSATLIDSQSDSHASNSSCCGSALYSKGYWLVSWGGLPLITEFAPNNRRTFKLTLTALSYRAIGVNSLNIHDFRAGMNAQVKPMR
ncbi:MAG: Arylsulfotransferase [Solirubrobacterales bacterium]|nr:Arylsulfotransferase [Solirubrobacterales bacterium]